ncbi:hypothetical protein I862_07295 [endosymbiont of Acanthamoeba sp. UWC8]|uniref:class I SAM-dependent methyltransferase n=1 Tax=endosymbiont of Acanthamoeba sp. UWC8 TaxID=86106 RepID=UPI0004D0C313|nr:class I SAM-dependent methyltransferase [endosymbiont of Acanthamoeba sp. UWC8]AIF82013.1 hypothetical protein I862_07295 [endosymbiont of Acanthamoeba sp. UWC8]
MKTILNNLNFFQKRKRNIILSPLKKTNFENLIEYLDTSLIRNILDIGAGGFVGETTTKHLTNYFKQSKIIALEKRIEACEQLEKKFAGKIEVICGDIANFNKGAPYDLIVIDLDASLITWIYEELLENQLYKLLKPNGYIIAIGIANIKNAKKFFSEEAARTLQEQWCPFMKKYIKASGMTLENMKIKFHESDKYYVLNVLDKWDKKENVVNWVFFQKKG